MPFTSPFMLLAQEEYRRPAMNLLQWMFYSLGLFYFVLLCGSGLAVFIGGLLVVALNRRPAVIAAYFPFVLLPLLIGLFATFDGFIRSMSVVATSAGAPQASHVAEGISTGLFSSLFGLGAMFPAYFVVATGLFLRTLFAEKPHPH
jgi:hypothetical protein